MIPSGPVTDAGTRSGPLLFFGGVYGNLPALRALRAWAGQHGYTPQQVFFTGDIAGYCARPAECMQELEEWGVQGIAGNVELQLRSGAADCGCNFSSDGRCDLFSRNWYPYTLAQMTPATQEWMAALPHHLRLRLGGKTILLVHGALDHTAGYIFRSTPWHQKGEQLSAAGADIIIGGHSGIPFAQQGPEGWWINAGAIGLPANDGTDRVWCASVSEAGEAVEVRFIPLRYPHGTAAAEMEERGLPASYARSLSTGLWDNCEILPAEETGLQGRPLSPDALVDQVLQPL